jgi:hypothetical protein
MKRKKHGYHIEEQKRVAHIVYIDDSGDEELAIFSGIAVPFESWTESFTRLREFRSSLKRTDGIFTYKELHAWKFVSGRGQIADRVVTKGRRCQIFRESLELLTGLPNVRVFNAVFPKAQKSRAFERLVNRINRTMEAQRSHAILICDEGDEITYTKLMRKMRIYNPIPSRMDVWIDTGRATRNMPIERIIEDPVFKDSQQSYYIQMADFVAYALLRRERPIESKSIYGIDTAFNVLDLILVREACRADPQGIIRP